MSGIGKTKKGILKMLSKKQHTLTELSQELGLSPSTVKQHIDELQAMGAISLVENEFIKRWKYYRATPNFEISGTYTNRTPSRFERINPYYVGSILLIAVAAVAAYSMFFGSPGSIGTGTTTTGALLGSGAAASSVPGYSLSVRLTDPPTVPDGTTSLVLNYSSVALRVTNGTAASGWVNISGSGSVNLMSLVNVSQFLGNATLGANDIVSGVRLYAKSSFITIGNVSYNVLLPENSIIANVKPTSMSSNSVILADFSPTIVSIYSSNTTTFLLVPSVKAVIYGSNTTQHGNHHASEEIENLTQAEAHMLANASAGIEVTGSSISTSGDNTSLSVTVKNTGNHTVTLRQLQLSGQIDSHVFIGSNSEINVEIVKDNHFPSGEVVISSDAVHGNGHMNANANLPPLPNIVRDNTSLGNITSLGDNTGIAGHGHESGLGNLSGGLQGNISAGAGRAANGHGNKHNGTGNFNQNASLGISLGNLIGNGDVHAKAHGHESISFPSFSNITINNTALNITGNITSQEDIGISHAYLHQLTFLISSNGTLSLPRGSGAADFSGNSNGYALQSGSAATFTFNGTISYGNGEITDTPVPGNAYKVIVMGSPGVLVHANATATAS